MHVSFGTKSTLENGPYVPITIVYVVLATATTPTVPKRTIAKELKTTRNLSVLTPRLDLLYLCHYQMRYSTIMHLKTSRDVWKTLCVQYEGTDDVLKSRKIHLVQQYKMFICGKNENLSQFH